MIARPRLMAPVARRTVADLAAEALRDLILRGDLAEGAPVRQDAVALELGVSRIPVREALRRLEAEGLVEFSPHCGAVVSSLSLEEIAELFDLRAMIESSLMRRAVPRMTRADLRHASDVLARYDEAFRERRVREWAELNWEFHSTLLAPAGRDRTLALVQNLHHQSERYMRMQLALTGGESRAHAEHRGILAAVRDGDSAAAARLAARHIRAAGRQLTVFLGRHRAAAEAHKGRQQA
ncbi:MAG TPA: GntR family transcriptional regulator [Gemmatimonadales bacterium]|nr:GntR family transcriptional regulator [Gemmatimonadales bacterium]